MPILGIVTFFLYEILKKTLGCDTDLLIRFILTFESLTLEQGKYFLDFFKATGCRVKKNFLDTERQSRQRLQ